MANQQSYQSYAQNKGTLVPGQSISVNKYTVQVERYLSQGILSLEPDRVLSYATLQADLRMYI